MPTFDYRCPVCGAEQQHLVFDALEKVYCDTCEEQAMDRLFGLGGVIFKGPGFYRTDAKHKK